MEEINIKQLFIQLISDNEGIVCKISRIYAKNHTDYEDLKQEIVYQLWKSFPTFRYEAKIQTWMYRVALNTAMYYQRKNKLRFVEFEYRYIGHNDSEYDFGQEENINNLYRRIRELKELDKAIILLYLEEKSYKQISEIVGITESNVGVRISRIKQELKIKMNSN